MTFNEIRISDLAAIYNTAEFAKTAIYKEKKIAVLEAKDEVDIFEISCKYIKGKEIDFTDITEGDEITVDGILYQIINSSPPKDFQITMSIKEKNV